MRELEALVNLVAGEFRDAAEDAIDHVVWSVDGGVEGVERLVQAHWTTHNCRGILLHEGVIVAIGGIHEVAADWLVVEAVDHEGGAGELAHWVRG